MAQFSPDSIERVKEASDIVEVVAAYTDLRRSGTRFTGLCPFHDERTPSFSVDPAGKLYHCFGCGVGGDVIKFVEEKEGLSFPDAVEALADRYGVEVEREREDPRAEEQRKRKARLRELLERTAAFYVSFLWDSPQGQKAREYLAARELGEEVVRKFGVGLAPSKWDTVLMRGQSAGYSIEEMRAAGLLQRSQKGRGDYDVFRSRIVFPIRDARGRIQGFGGRAVTPDQKPKYKNSPESDLYRKRETVYGIDLARAAVAKSRRVLVVEGYTDVLSCHQAGIENAVAVMGTAIAEDQLKELFRLLSGYAEEAVLALDADRSGREAMLRAEGVASKRRLTLRVARMPEGKDPADLLTAGDESARQEAARRFQRAVEDSAELPVFHVRTLLDEADLKSPTGRDRALSEAVPVIDSMPESITREELIREVADRLSADPGLVARRVAAGSGRGGRGATRGRSEEARGDGAVEASKAPGPRPLSSRERRERALLALCVAAPAEGAEWVERLTDKHLASPVARRARAWLAEHLEEPTAGLPRDDEELVSYVTELVMFAEREPSSREAMELNFLELERALLDDRIAAARESGEELPVELQRQRGELAERIAHFDRG